MTEAPLVRERALTIEADSCDVPVQLVWSRPSRNKAVVLLHEKRGLDEHTLDIARQLASEGYSVIVPDLLARLGGSSRGKGGLASGARGLPADWLLDDLTATVDAVLDLLDIDEYAALGYSFGGVLAWKLAASDPRCRVLIDYHGRLPDDYEGDLSDQATLVFLSELDDADKVRRFKQQLEPMRASHLEVIPEIHRGFEDPQRADRHDPEAAARAWSMTVGWLRGHLP